MMRLGLAAFLFFGSLLIVGCGDSDPSVPFSQSELEKHVQENPVPMVTDDDFRAADEVE